MDKFHKFLTRKNIYGCTLIIGVLLVVSYAFFDESRSIIYTIIFNPFWPAILGLFEIYIQTIEKEIAKENERKMGAVSGVIRGRLDNKNERDLLRSIMDAMTEKDLMTFNINKLESMDLEEKVEKAGEVKGESKGLVPN